MDVEEEPLLPLVRHRRNKTEEIVHTKHETGDTGDKDIKKKLKAVINTEQPYGGKVLKREVKPDHYYLIIIEVGNACIKCYNLKQILV